jgi:prepilin-type N-terminal cleavage/methylation domain-containing protein
MRSRSTSPPPNTNCSRRDTTCRSGREGFTLIEIIVAVAILLCVLALGLLISLDVYRGYAYRSERATVVALLTRARSHAMANVNQAPWGVCEDAGGGVYKLFRGAGYSASAYVDESVPVAPAGQVTGLPACTSGAGIVFSQLSGTTTAATITVQETAGPQTVTINSEGAIIW